MMEFRYSESGETVYLPAECVIENAAGIKESLLEALGRPETVHADVSGIKRLDLSGIQLLYAFLKSGESAGRRITLTGGMQEEPGRSFDASGYAEALEEYRSEAEGADER